MKKFIIGMAAVACLGSVVTSCTEEKTEIVKKYEVKTTSITMDVNTSSILTVGVSNMEAKWKSQDEHIVTVDKGVITAVREGVTTVSSYNREKEYKQDFIITVKKAPKVILSTNAPVYSVTAGETCSVLVYKDNEIVIDLLNYKSTDKKVFTVDKGKITGIAKGSAYLEVTSNDGYKTRAVVKVTEIAPEAVKSVNVSVDNVELLRNATIKVSAFAYPQNADNITKTIWKSLDSSIATIDENGLITAKELGETKVIATIAGISNYIKVKVSRTILSNFFYSDINTAYVLSSAKRSTAKLKSCVPSINNGAKVEFSIASVKADKSIKGLTTAEIAKCFSIDSKTGIVKANDTLKVGSYDVTVNAIGNFNATKNNEKPITLNSVVTFKSEADLTINIDKNIYKCRRGDKFEIKGSSRTIEANYDYKLAGITTGAYEGSWRPVLSKTFNEYYTLKDNVITLNEKVLNSTAEYTVYIYVLTAHEKGDVNNIAINIPENPTKAKFNFGVRTCSYLEELFFAPSPYNDTHINEKVITKYFVGNIKTNTKGDFNLNVRVNSQCEASIAPVSIINSDNNEVSRDNFFSFEKVDKYGLWFEYNLSSNDTKEIPDGNYTIKVKAIDSYDPMKVAVLTSDLNVKVISEIIDWKMLTAKDRSLTSKSTDEAIIDNPNGIVKGISLELSDATHFNLDKNNNVVLKDNVKDGVYPLTLKVKDTRNFVTVDVQTLTINVTVVTSK